MQFTIENVECTADGKSFTLQNEQYRLHIFHNIFVMLSYGLLVISNFLSIMGHIISHDKNENLEKPLEFG